MKKKTVFVVVSALCVASMAFGVFAAGVIRDIKAQLRPDFTVKIDGETKVFKNADGDIVYPVLYDGTTYLPIRAIGELMGKTVYWYEDDKLIELKEEKTTVTDADVIVTGKKSTGDSADRGNNGKKPAETKDKTADSNSAMKDEKSQHSGLISKEDAKEIALKKAGLSADDVIIGDFELDKDKNGYHYEFEFRSGVVEYEIDIDAKDGTVRKFEKEIE